MSDVVIRAICFASGAPCPVAGQYLESFDFDAHDGLGFGVFTRDLRKAKRFADKAEAWEFWRTRSTVKPTRPDGKANRPMTATTISAEPVP